MTAKTPRGLTLNNPCNLMSSSAFTWHGEIKPTSDPQHRLCQFDTVVNGLRAGCKNLIASQKLHGHTTVPAIITAWAPHTENPTEAYIDFIMKKMGLDPVADRGQAVNMTDASDLTDMVTGIIRFEQGFDACSLDQIHAGVQSALES